MKPITRRRPLRAFLLNGPAFYTFCDNPTIAGTAIAHSPLIRSGKGFSCSQQTAPRPKALRDRSSDTPDVPMRCQSTSPSVLSSMMNRPTLQPGGVPLFGWFPRHTGEPCGPPQTVIDRLRCPPLPQTGGDVCRTSGGDQPDRGDSWRQVKAVRGCVCEGTPQSSPWTQASGWTSTWRR